MGGEWRKATFGQLIEAGVLEVGDGYRAKNAELGGDGPIFLRAGHVGDAYIDFQGVDRFREELAHRVAPKMSQAGDIIVTTKGNSTGRVSFVGEEMPPFVYSPHLSYWRSLDEPTVVPGFLRYWSRGTEFRQQLHGLSQSTDMAPYLSLRDQQRLRITLPPTQEQRAIAHILGTLDDKIELNRRMSETLEAMARALFKSWFVDFDPVRAKMEGRWRPGHSLPGLPAHLHDLFPDRFVESELGEIPEGWDLGTVEDLGDLSRQSVKPGEFPEEVFHHYSIPAYDEGRMPRGQAGSEIKSNKNLVLPDSVLISKLNPRIPRVWLPSVVSGRRAICSTEFLVVRPKPGYSRFFLYALLTSSSFSSRFVTLVTGTSGSHQRVKPQAFTKMPILRSPKTVVERFASEASASLSRVESLRRESRTLAALRDTLLPKLVSGELRVNEASQLVESTP